MTQAVAPGRAVQEVSSLAVAGGTPVSKTSVPFMSTGLAQADIDQALAVLKSGMLRAAKKCEELEQRFGQMSSAKHMMTCANGTCALQLAYEPLFQPGELRPIGVEADSKKSDLGGVHKAVQRWLLAARLCGD